MNKKLLGVISCIIVVGVLVSGCTQIEEAGNLVEVTMQLNWVHQAQFAGMYVADQKGFYEEELSYHIWRFSSIYFLNYY